MDQLKDVEITLVKSDIAAAIAPIKNKQVEIEIKTCQIMVETVPYT